MPRCERRKDEWADAAAAVAATAALSPHEENRVAPLSPPMMMMAELSASDDAAERADAGAPHEAKSAKDSRRWCCYYAAAYAERARPPAARCQPQPIERWVSAAGYDDAAERRDATLRWLRRWARATLIACRGDDEAERQRWDEGLRAPPGRCWWRCLMPYADDGRRRRTPMRWPPRQPYDAFTMMMLCLFESADAARCRRAMMILKRRIAQMKRRCARMMMMSLRWRAIRRRLMSAAMPIWCRWLLRWCCR